MFDWVEELIFFEPDLSTWDLVNLGSKQMVRYFDLVLVFDLNYPWDTKRREWPLKDERCRLIRRKYVTYFSTKGMERRREEFKS